MVMFLYRDEYYQKSTNNFIHERDWPAVRAAGLDAGVDEGDCRRRPGKLPLRICRVVLEPMTRTSGAAVRRWAIVRRMPSCGTTS